MPCTLTLNYTCSLKIVNILEIIWTDNKHISFYSFMYFHISIFQNHFVIVIFITKYLTLLRRKCFEENVKQN